MAKKPPRLCLLCTADISDRGSRTIYCDKCKADVKARRIKEETKERRKCIKGDKAKVRPKASGVIPNLAPEGWDLRGKKASRVETEARVLGVSYGQYVAACNFGGIERIVKAKGLTTEECMKMFDKAWREKKRALKARLG